MYAAYGKRVLDLILASTALLVLSPLMLVLAGLTRLKLGSPVFFRQWRPGLRGKPFRLIKFRTMTSERDESGALRPDHQRLTSFGMVMRRASLDELPELFNVIRGDMSLVGPRPLLMQYMGRYTPEQMRRHNVRPGLTGWAQVNGRNEQTWERKFEMDLWYMDHISLALDLKILGLTLKQVFTGEGVSYAGHATMPEFMGSGEGGDTRA